MELTLSWGKTNIHIKKEITYLLIVVHALRKMKQDCVSNWGPRERSWL